MRVFLESIGCRLNQSEIETMARRLLAAGHEIVPAARSADKVILNTCAVTAEATKDARRWTRRIRRQNPGAEIILTGCYATLAAGDLRDMDGVSRVFLNSDKDRLVETLDPRALSDDSPPYDREPILREWLAAGVGNTRAFVKVQDGCDNRCTFCVTTIARGASRSRHRGDVVAEIRGLADAGYREAVLTGVHLGSYGHDRGQTAGLRDLVRAILEHTAVPRLRLSSLEPWDLAPDFFDLWEDRRLLPHLHLPLQSGSDRILRLMARRTTRSSFAELAEAARARSPDLNLTTDIIAGFPGETDRDFEESLEYVRAIGFSRLHVFSYSRRPGTVAASMPDPVPKPVIRERVRRMIALGKELGLDFHRRQEGRVREVLWEASERVAGSLPAEPPRRWRGYTDNYVRVATVSAADLFNRITATRLTGATPDGCSGDPV